MKKLMLVVFIIICVLSFSKKKEVVRTDIPVLTIDVTQEFPYEEYYPDCRIKRVCITSFEGATEMNVLDNKIEDPIYFNNISTFTYDYYKLKNYIFVFSKKDLIELGVINIENLTEIPNEIDIRQEDWNKYKITIVKLTKLFREGKVEFLDAIDHKEVRISKLYESLVFFKRGSLKTNIYHATADHVIFDQDGNAIFYGENERKPLDIPKIQDIIEELKQSQKKN